MTIFSARYVETLEFQNWKITALLQTFSAHPAVSYTHLDVYKRQVMVCNAASMVFSSQMARSSEVDFGASPVSYTHLAK